MAELKKRRKLTKKEAEQLLPIIGEFNKIASSFLKILSRKVDTKERKIAVMVTSMSMPKSKFNINIQTVDIRNTIVTKRGKYSTTQGMNWEEDIMKNLRRGQII